MKQKIEEARSRLGKAIERGEAPSEILSLSKALDRLIEEYLEELEAGKTA